LGEVWSLDTSGLHAAVNDGSEDRVHLVVDVRRGPDTEQYFPATTNAVRFHLVKFVVIMAGLLVRDVVTKPRSILARIPRVMRLVLPKRPRRSQVVETAAWG
jgi:hypothetical protein